MTEEPEDTGGTVWDAPNQQAVGLDPPWVEGTGGSAEAEPKGKAKAAKHKDDPEPEPEPEPEAQDEK
jgi:hypothetical protein